jgi:cytoskeleton protein RodZ
MSDVTPQPAGSPSAGAMLRAARQARGLEIDTLAQVLKVPARKLASLEADRYEELPGLAFVRSLAQTYARQVGLDATKVLALLPVAGLPPQQQLENVSRGLQTPYREGVSSNTFGRSGTGLPEWLKPAYLVPAVLLLLALAFWFAPPLRAMFGAIGWPAASAAAAGRDVAASDAVASSSGSSVLVSAPTAVLPQPVASAAVLGQALVAAPAVAVASEPLVAAVSETVHSAPPAPASTEASAPPTVAGVVVLRTTGESWIEVRDAGGAVLLSRTVLPGEVIGLDGALPMRLKAGIASVTQVTVRGEPFSLAPFTRGNIATAILK